jgi:hypothetical protein
MNAMKTLLAVSVLAATASAQAAVYNVTGTTTAWATSGATTTYPSGVPTFSGTLDDSTNAYSFNYATFTAHVDVGGGYYTADVTTTGQQLSGTGTGVVTRTAASVNCVGAAIICGSVPNTAINGTLAYSVSAGVVTGTLSTSQKTAGGPSTATYSFSGSAAPAVPVPAAAWLFGSGLVGLAGAARRRRA